jgi:hypothetical protein
MGQCLDFIGQAVDALVQPAPVAGQLFDDPDHARRQNIGARAEDDRQLGAQKAQPLAHRYSALQQEGANLIGDAGALADQPLPHPVQRLQVELLDRFGRDKLHRGALHGFRNRFRVAEVVLLSLRIGPHVLRRHQPSVVAKGLEPATEVMRANAGLHADQAPPQQAM